MESYCCFSGELEKREQRNIYVNGENKEIKLDKFVKWDQPISCNE